MDRWTDGMYRFPLYSTRLCPLWFPPEPLPCLHNSYHKKVVKQGRGTDDHLLPLGDWFSFFLSVTYFFLCLNSFRMGSVKRACARILTHWVARFDVFVRAFACAHASI